LRRHGKLIGIFSDYPASLKLNALGLKADFIVSAGDAEIGALKPDPRGLAHLMLRAGTGPDSTLMIGDRVERDGHVARRLGVGALIKSRKPLLDWHTFAGYDDAVFADILRA
jgi:putative hydrolase of the HAD superfamily